VCPLVYLQVLEEIFYREITPVRVRKDTLSLEDTFTEAVKVAGAYPEAKFR
jgi:hypothetical protein